MITSTFKTGKYPIGEDFFQTPEWATEVILPYVKSGSRVLEPTYGLGAIAKVLEKHECEVIGTDKYPKEGTDVKELDFLNIQKEDEILQGIDMIVFNPPFSDKTRFLQKAMKDHNLPHGMAYYNLLAEKSDLAEKSWLKHRKKQISK